MSRITPKKLIALTAVVLLFGFVFLVFARIRTASAASVSAPVPADSAQTKTAPRQGTLLYVTQKGDSMPAILRRYWRDSMFMSHAEMEAAIRQANPELKGNFFKPGVQVVIPGMNGPIVEKAIPVSRDYEVRAVYLTGIMAGSVHGLEIMRQWRAAGR